METSSSKLSEQFKDYSALMAATAAAMSTPFLAKFLSISPPEPQAPAHLEIYAGLLSLPLLIFCFKLLRRLGKASAFIFLLMSTGISMALTIFYIHSFQTLTIPIESAKPPAGKDAQSLTSDNTNMVRIIIGQQCGEDALLVYPSECKSPQKMKSPAILREFSSAGDGLPGSLWASDGIQQNTQILVYAWLSMYCSLVVMIVAASVVAR